jgi:hypothetical protein
MPPRKRRRIKPRKKKRHIFLILFLIVVGIFLFFEESGKEKFPRRIFDIFEPIKEPEITIPELPSSKVLPKVSIIMDDLGPSKKKAIEVLNIDSPLTLSILPHQRYSRWIAEEGYKRGRDIILHLPMEAIRPLKLGKGGLYTWMTDREIAETLSRDIRSIPYVKGISTHMGSAFTQDERAMKVVASEVKKYGLFFLDSITTSKSVAFRIVKTQGIKALKRDVFLDDKDDPQEIEIQWERLVKIAQDRGYAIAQVHPRKNSLEFLRKTLAVNNVVKVVPISELLEE